VEGCRKELGDLTNTLTNVLSRSTQYSEDTFKLKKEMFEKQMMMKHKMFLLSQLRHDIDSLQANRDKALAEVKEATQNDMLYINP
jgi:ElaB/YqjD/DUF883 family membrane-anchored ribosome-binding protein